MEESEYGVTEREIEASLLQHNDLVKVMPGARVPTDALVIKGSTVIDESMITGESMPVEKAVGDEVIGGTINSSGVITARVTRVGAETGYVIYSLTHNCFSQLSLTRALTLNNLSLFLRPFSLVSYHNNYFLIITSIYFSADCHKSFALCPKLKVTRLLFRNWEIE